MASETQELGNRLECVRNRPARSGWACPCGAQRDPNDGAVVSFAMRLAAEGSDE